MGSAEPPSPGGTFHGGRSLWQPHPSPSRASSTSRRATARDASTYHLLVTSDEQHEPQDDAGSAALARLLAQASERRDWFTTEDAYREEVHRTRTHVICTHTETRDITPRLRVVLERAGFRVAVLKAPVKA